MAQEFKTLVFWNDRVGRKEIQKLPRRIIGVAARLSKKNSYSEKMMGCCGVGKLKRTNAGH